MSRKSERSLNKVEMMIIIVVLLVLGTTIFQAVYETQQYFNAYVPPDGQWLMYSLALLGVAPVAYFATTICRASLDRIRSYQREKPAPDANIMDKLAYQAKIKPHSQRLIGYIVGGVIFSFAAAVGMVALNAFLAAPERESRGIITSLEERSTSTGSGGSRRYFCAVSIRVDDRLTLSIRQSASFCRQYDTGDALALTGHKGALGLHFYRIDG